MRFSNRRAALAAVTAAAATLSVAQIGNAASIPNRTQRITGSGGLVANGPSSNPVVSYTGRVVAFDSDASNLGPVDLNGAVRDVYSFDRETRRMRLVSIGFGGVNADGGSDDPDIAAASRTVVFRSAASNLVPGDTNALPDIFARTGDGELVRVSVGPAEPDGASLQPSISSDGRLVAFASAATNLVAGDSNGRLDVFVKDRVSGAVRKVSGGVTGQGNGDATTPSLSNDGRHISFASTATNLVPGDTNGKPDVFVVDLLTGRTELVSVSSRGAQQNDAVIPPFAQVSDVTDGGRFVAFDSDATNLVSRDRNRDTDVFVHDRRTNRTERVSLNSSGVEGNNDSFAPTFTPNGRYVAFQSFAENLAPGSAAGEDIFVRDRVLDATSVVSVTSQGRPRGPERRRQLLQRASISGNGRHVVFGSAAANLTRGDTNGVEDVFIRLTTAPQLRIVRRPRSTRRGRPTAYFRGDDRYATYALCRVDDDPQVICPLRRPFRVPASDGSDHTLRVNAGGPGMLFSRTGRRFSYRSDGRRPRVQITSPRRGARRVGTIRGLARDRGGSGVVRVEVSVNRVTTENCREYDGRRFSIRCRTLRFVRASGRRSWRLRLRERPRGRVIIRARAIDRAGNVGPTAKREIIVR